MKVAPLTEGIDVVIPVFNGQEFIVEALESVARQTCPPRQIIVVDDGSTDGTAAAVRNYADSKPSLPLVYIHKPNGGLSSARNKGLERCSSQYVAFLDADDVWEKHKLEAQLRRFRQNGFEDLGVVYCDYSNIDPGGNFLEDYPCFKLNPSIRGDIFAELISGNFVAGSGSGVLVKRECFERAGVFDEALPTCEDWDMWARIAQYYRYDFVDEKLVRLRRHPSSMSQDNYRMYKGTMMVWSKLLRKGRMPYRTAKDFSFEFLLYCLNQALKHNRNIYKELGGYASPAVKKALFFNPLVILPVGTKIGLELAGRAVKKAFRRLGIL